MLEIAEIFLHKIVLQLLFILAFTTKLITLKLMF